MYSPARAARSGLTGRAGFGFHSPHTDLGQSRTSSSYLGPPPDEPATPTEQSSTLLYVGIGLGVLLVGGTVVYLATRKQPRRRARR